MAKRANLALVAAVLTGLFVWACWPANPTAEPITPPIADRPALPIVGDDEPSTEQTEPPAAVKRFATVEKYFSDGNPNPLSYRVGLPRYERDVPQSLKAEIIKRDGGCCLVCGSFEQLEVDHKVAIMNNGDNSPKNLGTLCDSCHTEKTKYDWAVQRKRRKQEAERRQQATEPAED